MLRSKLCYFNNAYIVVKGDSLASQNNALFANCMSKINNVLIDNAEDLDVVMPM